VKKLKPFVWGFFQFKVSWSRKNPMPLSACIGYCCVVFYACEQRQFI